MRDVNPFRFLPFFLALQIAAGVVLGGAAEESFVDFPESDAKVEVEIADSPGERRKGLMYRKKLPIDEGMLFVYPEEGDRSFWMKNTLISLDIIFVDRNGKIINIEEAYPQPNASDSELKNYRSDEPAKYVIETNSSFTERKDVEEGDRVSIPEGFQ
jgi:uncharacterized membrane protein (UPF0127 family)